MNYKTFLIELNIEEIPAKQIRNIANQFYLNFRFELDKNNIEFSRINTFETSRRIALIIKKLNTSPILKKIKSRGPSVKHAFDTNGLLKKPALKWLKKNNITLKQTKKIVTEKGTWLFYEYNKQTIPIKNILIDIINTSIKNIAVEKAMSWNQNHEKFIRPVRKIIILLDTQLIPFYKYGVYSKKYLYGNMFNKFNKIRIQHAQEYEHLLYQKGQVIAKFDTRKKKIQYQIQKITNKIQGKTIVDDNFIEEITGLVEWPKILLGKFKKIFLNIPKDIIIYIMETIHKLIPIYNYNNQLTNNFIIVTNNNSHNNKKIILGNERVLHAKLFDIEFFIKKDHETQLKKQFSLLCNIIFYEKLGTMLDKTNRLIELIQYISKHTKSNLYNSTRAAYLSKCDLNTYMVYEFPELKGIIGMYYALHDGESHEIALSIHEQYKPRFFNDTLPSTPLSIALALTEKIDTIVGLFIINKIPTQDKDPFFLRRLAIGIIRIIIEKKININLYTAIEHSIFTYSKYTISQEIIDSVISFIINRLYAWYKKKYSVNIIKSVLKNHNNNLLTIDIILHTILKFQNHIFFKNLIITYKRISNLIRKINIKYNITHIINYQIFQNEEEKILFIKINNIHCILNILVSNKNYSKALKKLFELNSSINNFLNHHSIKFAPKKIQKNRILLLLKIQKLFLKITDFIEL